MAADEPRLLYCRYFQDEEESPVVPLKLTVSSSVDSAAESRQIN